MRTAAAEVLQEPWAPPYPVPEIVRRVCEQEDWDGHLPARSRSLSWRVGRVVKRGVDIAVALAALVFLSPVLLALMALVRASSPGPIFYRWRVLGRRGKPFIGYKLRTMVEDADALKRSILHQNEMTGPAFKMRDDPRVTAVGRVLRKFSLDELPQLWSVLKGDMSLVGPRPPSAEEFAAFEPWQRGKLAVTPGITCLWQVSGRSDITDFDHWMRLDREYVQGWSLWLDLRILARTLPAVIRGDGAY